MKLLKSITGVLSATASGFSIIFSRRSSKLYNNYDYIMTRVSGGPELRLDGFYEHASTQTSDAQFTDLVPAGYEIVSIFFNHKGIPPSGKIRIGTVAGGRDVVCETHVISESNGLLPLGNNYFGNKEQTLYLSESSGWTPGSELDLLITMRDKIARIPWK